jgi:hypothetical protein
MAAAKEKKILFQTNIYSTAVPANGSLCVSNRNQLFALTVRP